jgi:hypothetical protein
MEVTQFNEKLAKEELAKCPQIVQDYVRLIMDHWDKQKELTAKAIGKLKEIARNNDGLEVIANERIRQIQEEGWSPEHDDQHEFGELSNAAAAYALTNNYYNAGNFWPWHPDWFKPTPDDRIKQLGKAGALIAAEIDRLKRKQNDQ